MIDRLTLDKWRGEFAIWAAGYADTVFNLTIIFVKGEPYWESEFTQITFEAYCMGRMHESCAKAACELAQTRILEVLRVVDCQDVSYSGRAGS